MFVIGLHRKINVTDLVFPGWEIFLDLGLYLGSAMYQLFDLGHVINFPEYQFPLL